MAPSLKAAFGSMLCSVAEAHESRPTAFVYGSVAKATDQSASDIDPMIISDSLTHGEVFGALERVTHQGGRNNVHMGSFGERSG